MKPRTRTRRAHAKHMRPKFPERTRTPIELPAYTYGLFVPKRYKVLWGGRGAARSWSIARALLLIAAQKPTRILCTREMQSSLRDSVHQLLRDQIDLMQLPGFLITDREIRHVNGSLFLFEGLRHNITKIKSLEGIDICWVEEAERISNKSWQTLIPTIRKKGSEIWISFNPDQEEDATYQRFIVRTPKDIWRVKVSWEDNPWLSEELREEKDYAYAVDAEAADHIWGGNIRVISDAQILRGKWSVEEFTVPYVASDKDPNRLVALWNGPYQGEDFGFSTDPHAAIRAWVNDDTLYIEHESWKLHLELDDIPAYVTDTEHGIPDFEKYVTRADSSRPDSISYLRRHGLPRVEGAKKGANSIEDGIAHLRSYKRIIIHPRCIRTQQEAKRWSYKVDALSGDVLPIVLDAHNHLMDALRYALEPLILPRRKMGFIFTGVDGAKRVLCKMCDSFMPDDGECPHCGYDEKAQEHLTDYIADAPVLDTPMVSTHKHENGNGNGNGNGHTNGHGPERPSMDVIRERVRVINTPPTTTRTRLRGING